MRNWAYYITGDNPENLQGHSPESIRKIKILATVVLLPAIIWLMLGYCFGSTFLHLGFVPALICGMVAGTVVFLVDRMIIMANDNSESIKRVRVTLAVMVAILGSIIADHVVFKDDIQMMMSTIESERARDSESATVKDHGTRLAELKLNVDKSQTQVVRTRTDFLKETDGTGGTGQRGVGTVAKEKKKAWNLAQTSYQNALSAYNRQLAVADQEKSAASQVVRDNFSENALLTQIRAMFRFLWENPIAFVFWGPFTLIMFLLEILPLLIKSSMEDSAYEIELKYIEEIRKRRVDLMKSEFEHQFKLTSGYSESDRGAMRVLSTYQVNSIAS